MSEELEDNRDLTACALNVLERVKRAALGEALLDAYGDRLIIELWREHTTRSDVGLQTLNGSAAPPADMNDFERHPVERRAARGPRRVDVEQLGTDTALLEALFYVDGAWMRLGDLDKSQCRALHLKYASMASGFKRLAEGLGEGQTVRQRWTAKELAGLVGDTLSGTAPARPTWS